MAIPAESHRLLLEQARGVERAFGEIESFMHEPSLRTAARFEEIRKKADARGGRVVEALDADGPAAGDAEDRAALFRLARALEAMAECAHAALGEMLSYKAEPDVFLREAARIARELCLDLAEGWRWARSQPVRSSEHMVRARRAERQAAHVCRQAVASLLKNPSMLDKLKTQGVYRHFAEAAHQGGIAADVIGDMLVESQAKA